MKESVIDEYIFNKSLRSDLIDFKLIKKDNVDYSVEKFSNNLIINVTSVISPSHFNSKITIDENIFIKDIEDNFLNIKSLINKFELNSQASISPYKVEFKTLKYLLEVNETIENLEISDFRKLYLYDLIKRIKDIPVEFFQILSSEEFLKTIYVEFDESEKLYNDFSQRSGLIHFENIGKLFFKNESITEFSQIPFKTFYEILVLTNLFIKRSSDSTDKWNYEQWFKQGFVENIKKIFGITKGYIWHRIKYHSLLEMLIVNKISFIDDDYLKERNFDDLTILSDIYFGRSFLKNEHKINISKYILSKGVFYDTFNANTLIIIRLISRNSNIKFYNYLGDYIFNLLGFDEAFKLCSYIIENNPTKLYSILDYIEYKKNTNSSEVLGFPIWSELFYEDEI